MIGDRITVLLGEPVAGVSSTDGLTTSWTVTGGPYEAVITEWPFDGKNHYRYEFRVNRLVVLSQSTNRSTDTIEEAIEKVEETLRDYLVAQAIIERRFGPGSNFPATIMEYQTARARL